MANFATGPEIPKELFELMKMKKTDLFSKIVHKAEPFSTYYIPFYLQEPLVTSQILQEQFFSKVLEVTIIILARITIISDLRYSEYNSN